MKKQPVGAGTAARRDKHRPDSDSPLEITALGMIADPAFDPADPTLPRIAEKIVIERTGVRCAWPAPERDWTLERLLREAGRTGTLPHVLAVAGLFKQAETRDAVLRENLAHEVTEELVEQHMPLYAARVRRYGWSVREVLARNRCGGRSICVPMGFGFDEFPGLVDHPGAKAPISFYYALDFRDDILAKIIPGARSEAQLRDLLARKGSLDIHDLVDDLPLRSLEDLRQYFLKVRALGVKAGDSPVVPASPIVSFEHPESMYWSLGTAAGLFWDYPFIVGDPPDWERTHLFWFTRECQRYLRWWNRIWHDGLLGDDPFAMAKAEQREGQRAGRYAVINDWSDPEEARAAALERGYGYRYFPLFLGGWSDIWGNYALPVECREGPLVFTRRIRGREALARVMRWADWHLGEERDVLAYWGLPDWHAGTGSDRRFTWQHAALEDWSVYGICSDRDGPHVGLEHTPAVAWDPSRSLRLPLGPLSFFTPESAYPEAPYWVYPREGRKVLQTHHFGKYCDAVMKAARCDEYRVRYRGVSHRTQVGYLPEVIDFDIAQERDHPAFAPLVRDVVMKSVDRFESSYGALCGFYRDRGVEKARRAFIERLQAFYRTEIEPNIFFDRRT